MTSSHDTIAVRLAQILVKLNQGEKLAPSNLATEFGVTLRTIQRDLNERFAYLPMQRTNGLYHLDPLFLGKLSIRDIERFAGLAGVNGLFPSLDSDFLRHIFNTSVQSAFLVKGHCYEDLSSKVMQFSELEEAIMAHQYITFHYQKAECEKSYVDTEPYKLVNNKGIWYLAAIHDGKLKTFAFSRIRNLQIQSSYFELDNRLLQRLKDDDGIWLSEDNKEIILKISREAAAYFKRRNLIANQVIEKELEDGGLIVSTRVGHSNQILPIVRYWIPYIRIISPEEMQDALESELTRYLER